MAKKNYSELAEKLLTIVGGKENIAYFSYCTTRLRFNLKDKSIVEVKKIENLAGVLGSQWSNQELQVIIGSDVSDLYKVICETAGIAQVDAIQENLDKNLTKQKLTVGSVLSNIMDGISGSITPLIPMMIGGGMIKVLNIILSMTGILAVDSTTYLILTWVGDAFIYFFPVFIGATAAKKFGANIGLGMLFGGLLIYPAFITAVGAGTPLTLFGLPVYLANYSSTLIPIIMIVYVMSKVQKVVARYSPAIVRSFLEPLLTTVIMLPLALVVIAPLGYYIGTYVAAGVGFLYTTIGFVGVAVLATLLPLMVMTGMHTMMTPYWLTAFMTLGFDAFFIPAMIVSNINQATASLAVAFKAKSKDLKAVATSCAVTAYVAGVTEPAMFGITFKYKKPFYAAMVGNFAGGLVLGIFAVKCYAFPGSGGIFAFPTFIGADANNIIYFLIAIAVGMIVTFVLTLVLGFNEDTIENA